MITLQKELASYGELTESKVHLNLIWTVLTFSYELKLISCCLGGCAEGLYVPECYLDYIEYNIQTQCYSRVLKYLI